MGFFVLYFTNSCATNRRQHITELSLRNTFEKDFDIGTAPGNYLLNNQPELAEWIPRQFNTITPENIMKAGLIHPEWNRYDFTAADQLVDFASRHKLLVNAHTLIWHSQLPAFTRSMRNADSVRMFFRDHIQTVAGRYRGKVHSWDVVNEALDEDGSLRKSIFLNSLGEDYIVEAFRLAGQADPAAELYYNDYNIEQPRKRAGAIKLIKKLQAAGVRIDGVGIQGHWSAGDVPLEKIEQSILEFSALGIQVMFTELDLSVLPNPWNNNTADINQTASGNRPALNPYPGGLPDSVQTKLSNSYAQLFRLFLKHSDKISRITFWGINDGHSWLNNWPIRGRTNYPLLFDRQNQPKQAFYAVIGTKDKKEKY